MRWKWEDQARGYGSQADNPASLVSASPACGSRAVLINAVGLAFKKVPHWGPERGRHRDVKSQERDRRWEPGPGCTRHQEKQHGRKGRTGNLKETNHD